MKRPWYEDIYNFLERFLVIKIPLEIIHFPSTGITSSLNREAIERINNKDKERKIIVIDLRSAYFDDDSERNHQEFYRLVTSHLEQYLHVMINDSNGGNFFRNLEKIFTDHFEMGQSILMVFATTSQVQLKKVPEFRDFLLFLDRIRDYTDGKLNFIITSTYTQFEGAYFPPVPFITKHFNYFEPGRIYRTYNEDIFLKKLGSHDILKMIEITGGMASIAKSLQRDFTLLDIKPSAIYDRKYDADFFDEFLNCRLRLERIYQQLHPDVRSTLSKIIIGLPLTELDNSAFKYLKEVGVLDDQLQVRSPILVEFLKLNDPYRFENEIQKLSLTTENTATDKPQAEAQPKAQEPKPIIPESNYATIGKHLKVHQVTGDILRDELQVEHFSENELQVFNMLYSRADTDVSRDLVAKAIWGSDYIKYSDWAIDKLVSRLRDKLGDKRPNKIIKTVRNRGFMLLK